MIFNNSRCIPIAAVVVLGMLTHFAQAEFPALEQRFAPVVAKLAERYAESTILVSMGPNLEQQGWDLASAIETEIVAQFRLHGIRVTDDDHDERMEVVATRGEKFRVDGWRQIACHDYLLVANLQVDKNQYVVTIYIHSADQAANAERITVRLTNDDLAVENNIPQLNRSVLGYLQERHGQMIGKGNDSVAAILPALSEFKCRRFGVFTLGRQLGPGEAVLPGDILYFANVQFAEPAKSRTRRMPREFMMVSVVNSPVNFEVLHQPIQTPNRKGVVGTETIDMLGVESGRVIVYRPTLGDESQLPMTFGPLRKRAPEVDWSTDQPIDLLAIIEPELDSVRGSWAMKDGKLWFGYERQNKLQIPVYVPTHYSLKFTATRNYGKHGVTVVPVVAGKQIVLTMDGFDDGITAGIGLIDRKMENKNETTIRKQIFKNRQPVEIEVQVRDNHLKLIADGEVMIDWSGNPKRLALHRVHNVPAKDWIHMGGYESDITISSLTIERLK